MSPKVMKKLVWIQNDKKYRKWIRYDTKLQNSLTWTQKLNLAHV